MLINYFLMLVTLLLISGLALDAGLLGWRQIHLQNAADAAAEEGMYQLSRGDSAWSTEGQAQAAANGFTNGVNGVTVTLLNPPATGTYASDTFAVRAVVSQTVGNMFMGLINAGQSTVSATAVAREIPTCIWIMNPNNSSNLYLASAGLYASCGTYINTPSGNALCSDGFSTFRNWRTRAVSPASAVSNCGGTISPSIYYSSATKSDPLAYVTAPASTFTCTYSSATTLSGVTTTINPANFCGGLTITNSTITLQPGTYIFADGLTISNSTINGTSGVTLYLTKHNSASYTNTSVTGSTLYLKAPTSTANGGITGVVIFADRNWVKHGTSGVQLHNSTTVQTDGAWYILNTGLSLQNCSFNYYTYDIWVIDSLYQYATNAVFNSNFSSLGGVSPLHYEDGVLVQ